MIRRLISDESGATAIEYALIAALIAMGAIVAMQGVGNEVTKNFEDVEAKLSSAGTA
uniref:Flp family type IVb pilin n=1 Tax=Parerythrobacter lutipelagi TaxID=1964208 RepID=UPI001EFFD648|nr:Flp family type IVb pilin [Parerythrobacter lutipelagi]